MQFNFKARRGREGAKSNAWQSVAPVRALALAVFLAVVWAAGALPPSTPAAAQAADGALRILMLGDSLTAGYGLAADDALPARLERAIRALDLDIRMINAGVSGDTTAGGLARLDWALADRPHAVIVALGANDALRGVDPGVPRDNMDQLLAALKERGLPTLVAGMLAPRSLGPEYTTRFDTIFPDLADRHGALLYPFLLDGVATITRLNQEDGIHPNIAGVDIIVERLAPSVLCLAARTDHPVAALVPERAGERLPPDCLAASPSGTRRQRS